ncbi:MAG: hypothetical protein JEZ06_05835 [Anaerolineaceae bacterium]|nr:hypothetical protein [Anaerolineaceae bacterium]
MKTDSNAFLGKTALVLGALFVLVALVGFIFQSIISIPRIFLLAAALLLLFGGALVGLGFFIQASVRKEK